MNTSDTNGIGKAKFSLQNRTNEQLHTLRGVIVLKESLQILDGP